MVSFSYVDSGSASIASLGVHLAAYQVLFRHLSAFRFVYVAPGAASFGRAEKRFRSSVKEPLETDVAGEILRYFAVRCKWERHEYIVPHTEDLEFLSDGRRRFYGQRFEDLYRAWLAGSLDEAALRLEFRCRLLPLPKGVIWRPIWWCETTGRPWTKRTKRHVNAA